MEIYTIRVRSNPARYSNQHHMYYFVSDLRQVVVFLRYSGFFHQKTDLDDIAEILLKVALNTITLTPILSEDISIFIAISSVFH